MIGRLLEAPRPTKRLVSVSYDFLALTFAFYLAIVLRLGSFEFDFGIKEFGSLAVTLVVSLYGFKKLGLYRAILRFMAQQALVSVSLGIFISAAALATSSFFLNATIPRSVPIIYALAALFLVGTPRLLIRSFVFLLHESSHAARESIVIYGAGHSGFQLANALQDSQYRVIGFVDDNARLTGTTLRGLPVSSPQKLPYYIRDANVKIVMLALGNAPRSVRASIIKSIEPLGVNVKTMPAMSDILSGKSNIQDIKDVEVEDLLGRDSVQANPALLGACIKDKHVLVTGSGGSIGSELCRQILKQLPKKLVLFELNEFNLYKVERELEQELGKYAQKIELISLMGNVQNKTQLDEIFATFNIHTVYHAAAYKHVPLIEHNIVEGVKNNVFGTLYCAQAAIKAKVESFVLISTDKAVRPTNVMGATKRIAELVLQGLAKEQSMTRFTMVRFGNVLGSSGSVVPLFRQQIQNGGPITVTHPDIIRYFMTIPEAAELVIQAGSMGKGGDVFVLDMGEPVKIIDLAKRMIHLSGLTLKDENHPEGDIEIQFTGLRPGEKLYEELLIGDNVSGTIHQRILRAEEKSLSWEQASDLLECLNKACISFHCEEVKEILVNAPTDYFAESEIKDWTWSYKKRNSKLRIIT